MANKEGVPSNQSEQTKKKTQICDLGLMLSFRSYLLSEREPREGIKREMIFIKSTSLSGEKLLLSSQIKKPSRSLKEIFHAKEYVNQ